MKELRFSVFKELSRGYLGKYVLSRQYGSRALGLPVYLCLNAGLMAELGFVERTVDRLGRKKLKEELGHGLGKLGRP